MITIIRLRQESIQVDTNNFDDAIVMALAADMDEWNDDGDVGEWEVLDEDGFPIFEWV